MTGVSSTLVSAGAALFASIPTFAGSSCPFLNFDWVMGEIVKGSWRRHRRRK